VRAGRLGAPRALAVLAALPRALLRRHRLRSEPGRDARELPRRLRSGLRRRRVRRRGDVGHLPERLPALTVSGARSAEVRRPVALCLRAPASTRGACMLADRKLAACPADDLTAAVVAAAEAVQLRDLADEALPSLQRAVGASNALLYRYGESGALEGVAGSLRDALMAYSRELVLGDPLQRHARLLPPGIKVVMCTREVDCRSYRRSDAYHHFYRPHDVEHVMCTWINGQARYGEPGMTGILLARAGGQDPFTEREALAIEQALPAFAAAARRSARVEAAEGRRMAVEALAAGAVTRPLAALAPSGRVLWMSPAAEALLAPTGALPPALVDAARRLAAL